MNTFTKRKIYNDDGSIDYSKYNQFEFDYQSIEEELAKLILPGKCLFEDENHLNFINYFGEIFKGRNSDFLERFENLYETEELSNNEKEQIYCFFKKNFSNQNTNDLKQIYINLQLIIFYLINNYENDIDKSLKEIIKDSYKYTKINDENIINIFDQIYFNGKKLISIFIVIEYLCFDLFIENIKNEYKEQIEESIKTKIKDKIFKNENIKEIAASVRRFISRFLYQINIKDELSPKGKLTLQLKNKYLWSKELRSTQKIINIIESIEEFNLNIGQAFHFYQLIKEEDEKEIKIYYEKHNKRRRKFRQ